MNSGLARYKDFKTAVAQEFAWDFLVFGEAIELFSIIHNVRVEVFQDSTAVDQFFCCLHRLVTLKSYTPHLQSLINTQEDLLVELYPNYKNSPLESYLLSSVANFEGFSGYNPLVRITRFLKHQALNT